MKYFTDALFLFSTFFVVTLNYKFSFLNLVMAMCCSFSVGLSIRSMTIYDDIYASKKFVLHFNFCLISCIYLLSNFEAYAGPMGNQI